MSFEHPVTQPVRRILVWQPDYPAQQIEYEVGYGCTRIEATTKSGLHADVPYFRVWDGDTAVAEFCQHNIVGVWFNSATDQPTSV